MARLRILIDDIVFCDEEAISVNGTSTRAGSVSLQAEVEPKPIKPMLSKSDLDGIMRAADGQ